MLGRMFRITALIAWALAVSGCVAIQRGASDPVRGGDPARPPLPAAAHAFERALAEFTIAEASAPLSKADCTRLSEAFLEADALSGAGLPEARFDAGLSYQRCGLRAEARRAFESVLAISPQHGPARVELALEELERTGRVDDAILALNDVVSRARYQDAPTLVKLAALRLRRNPEEPSATDVEAAQRDVQRALAVDDAFMPAYNELALMHLRRAQSELGKARAPSMALASQVEAGRRTQALDMAALVASQGLAQDPSYAPLHNTAGLVAVELGEFHTAIESFERARTLRPSLLEASHNYAALSLMIRSFERAERAYRDVLARAPDDYEAHLGLSLALRGQAKSPADLELIDAAERSLHEAIRLAPERPEAYFNRAILTSELRAKVTDTEASLRMLRRAHCELSRFTARARHDGRYAVALKRAEERRRDMSDVLLFLGPERSEESAPPLAPLECG